MMDKASLVFTLFAFLFIEIFIWGLYHQAQLVDELRQSGGRAQGVILRNKIHWGRITVVRAFVQFHTEDGQLVEAEDELGTAMAIPKFSAGQQVGLYYDKNNPKRFVIVTPGNFS